MKIIQFAAVFTLLSVSSPLAQASYGSFNTNKDVIQKQENDAVNPILTTSSSSSKNHLLRGAANLAWNLLGASNGADKQDGNDKFVSEECQTTCCNHHNKCRCCGSAHKDDAIGEEDVTDEA